MSIVKTFTTIVILFVAFNLIMTIYRSIKLKSKEGFENKTCPEDHPYAYGDNGQYCCISDSTTNDWNTLMDKSKRGTTGLACAQKKQGWGGGYTKCTTPPCKDNLTNPDAAKRQKQEDAMNAPAIQPKVQYPTTPPVIQPTQQHIMPQEHSTGQQKVFDDIVYQRTGRHSDPLDHRKKGECMSGCRKHNDIDGNCDNKVYSGANGKYYRKCSYICPGPADQDYNPNQECEYAESCNGCGTFNIETNSKGYSIGSSNISGSDIGPGSGISGLNSADITTDSRPSSQSKDDVNFQATGYPNTTWRHEAADTGNITQERLQIMGRRFMSDELARKGIASSAILDSEAEILGRLVLKVQKSAEKLGPNKLPMRQEKKLMNKLSEIYRTHSDSQKISQKQNPLYQNSTNVTTDNASRSYAQNRTTGLMTNAGQNDHDLLQSDRQLQTSNSLNPSRTISYLNTHNPYRRYKTGAPRNPNLSPSPYNAIMNLFK